MFSCLADSQLVSAREETACSNRMKIASASSAARDCFDWTDGSSAPGNCVKIITSCAVGEVSRKRTESFLRLPVVRAGSAPDDRSELLPAFLYMTFMPVNEQFACALSNRNADYFQKLRRILADKLRQDHGDCN